VVLKGAGVVSFISLIKFSNETYHAFNILFYLQVGNPQESDPQAFKSLFSAVIICMLTCSKKTASFLKHLEIKEEIIWHVKCSNRNRILN
jgi:hypothetical protein